MKRKVILIILGLGILGTAVLLINGLINKPEKESTPSNTNMIKEDENTAINDTSATMEYSDQVSISLENKYAELYFKNPGTSGTNMVLEIIASIDGKEVTIAKSDMIKAGYAVYGIELDNVNLKEGSYKGKFRTKYYNPKDEREEMVGAQIDIDIIVK